MEEHYGLKLSEQAKDMDTFNIFYQLVYYIAEQDRYILKGAIITALSWKDTRPQALTWIFYALRSKEAPMNQKKNSIIQSASKELFNRVPFSYAKFRKGGGDNTKTQEIHANALYGEGVILQQRGRRLCCCFHSSLASMSANNWALWNTFKAQLKQKSNIPWYNDAQWWVKANGISDGTRPEEPATRAEVWQMLYRLSKLQF